MVMKRKINMRTKLLLLMMFVAGGMVAVANLTESSETEGISLACSRSEECKKAAAEEEQANKNAANASNTATMYQTKVNELTAQITAKQKEIGETEGKVKELKDQIAETEKKLSENQTALAELLIDMHFDGDAEPITILAGSSSISDLAEKAARNEVVKQQISVTATKIKDAKQKLEDDKAQVEALLEQQKTAKKDLEASQAEQQTLVAKYQNDAAAYEKEAKEALARKIAAEEEYQRTHRDEFVSGVTYSGLNSYPWRDKCPSEMDQYYTIYNGSFIGGYVCECTSYAGWKAYEATGGRLAISWWGNAKSWAESAKAKGFTVDKIPAANSIGQSGTPSSAGTGHVFWVESVNSDGSVNITEYNNWWATGKMTGSYHVGDFAAQTISVAEASKYNYIHVR